MNRWIYSFQSTGIRELTDLELAELNRRLAWIKLRTILRTLISIALGFGIFLGIIVATSNALIGWSLCVASTIAFFYSLSFANAHHSAWLLYSRASRKRTIETFAWSNAPREVRSLYALIRLTTLHGDKAYWKEEEELVDTLQKMAKHEPKSIETLVGDGAIIRINGSFATREITVPVADLDARTVGDCPIDAASIARAAAVAPLD